MAEHVVQHCRFDLACERIMDPARYHQLLAGFEQQLLTLLDDIFSDLCADDQRLEITKLSLDLGAIGDGELWQLDGEQLRRHVEDQLRAQHDSIDSKTLQLQNYLHFLLRGRWPAGSGDFDLAELEQSLLQLERGHWQSFLTELRQLSAESVQTQLLPRIFLSHSKAIRDRLAAALISALPSAMAVAAPTIDDQWLFICQQLGILSAPCSEHWQTLALQQACSPLQLMAQHLSLPAVNDPEYMTTSPSETMLLDSCSQQVGAAGIVLLAPFLPTLFEQMGWLAGKRFNNSDTQQQAVYALHYLATGQEGAAEPALTLQKFLVGLPSVFPLAPHRGFSAEHRELMAQLLDAAISHWQALKNTSSAGLQESFLNRQGSLKKLDEGLQLTVESSGIDILLDNLPWGIGCVQLPWQVLPLFIKWR